jgi:hypothetical protein
MDQPRRDSSVDTRPPCPECADHRTVVTAKSIRGAYCRCETCGHIWHQDQRARLPPGEDNRRVRILGRGSASKSGGFLRVSAVRPPGSK